MREAQRRELELLELHLVAQLSLARLGVGLLLVDARGRSGQLYRALQGPGCMSSRDLCLDDLDLPSGDAGLVIAKQGQAR